MEKFNVLLDSNVIINAQYDFLKGTLSNLKKQCDSGKVALFTNDIILREVRRHIVNDVGLLARQAKNAIKKNKALFHAISSESYNAVETILSNAVNNLQAQFESFIDEATIIPNGDISVDALFDDYFEPRAPFENSEKKKAEFPDAVVIMSIKRYLEQENGSVLHIVTDDNGWHNALQDASGVYVYKTLKELLTRIAKEEELYAKIAEYMGDCIGVFENSTTDWIESYDWSSALENIDICIECDEIDDIVVSKISLVPDGVEYIDEMDCYAVAAFSGTATICVDFSYIDHTNEIYDREDHVWFNTVYGKGKATLSAHFMGSATVLIGDNDNLELNSKSFDVIDLGDIELLEYKLMPYREDDDPYFNICPDCGDPIGIHNDGGNGFCIKCAPQH